VRQREFEKYRDMGFTVVGIALDSEGIEPAKLYYEKYNVTFPALVDPNYATGLTAVPKTFFVNEHGVVQDKKDWEQKLKPLEELAEVTDKVRAQWSQPGKRLAPEEISRLVAEHLSNPANLATAVELASRYLDLDLKGEARQVLLAAVDDYEPRQVAQASDREQSRLLGQAYFQLARASKGNREDEVRYATTSFYLNPSVGFGKQIARIIAPEKFDHRPKGDFDNAFREGTLRRLRSERNAWLEEE
jgi:peroxiredoxin